MLRRVLLVCLCLGGISAAETKPPKEGSYYTLDQVGISKSEVQGSVIKLTFKPKDEQFYWCPGAKVQVTKKATAVTFVRCKTSADCDIDEKAAIGKKLVRTISIDTHNQDVYVRISATKFKRIYKHRPTKKPQPAEVKKAKTAVIKNRFARRTDLAPAS